MAVYLALGIKVDGNKEVLGMWAASSEGAKFWLHVLTELKNRGVRDIFIGCVDGIKGFPEAMEAVFPATQVQLCLVHMVRNSLSYVGWKERKEVAADLKAIYRAATEAGGRAGAAGLRAQMGPQISLHQQELARALAGAHHLPEVSGRDPQSHLHHQRH